MTPDGGDPLLRIYAWYRFALSILLLLSYFAFSVGRTETVFLPLLYLGTAIPYAVLNLVVLVGVLARARHPRPRHVFLILVLDIAALVLITHASGGINSGFAILLMVTVAAAAIFVPGQIATLVAAVASLAVLADATALVLTRDNELSTLLPAGLPACCCSSARCWCSGSRHACASASSWRPKRPRKSSSCSSSTS